MDCPICQTTLVAVPTAEGPQIDVCPARHGLWVDLGEINFYVEDYRTLCAGVDRPGGVAVTTATAACPRCATLLDEQVAGGTAFVACRSCRGWWLPQGSLMSLQQIYRGGAVPILQNEDVWYARAAAKQAAQAQRPRATSPPEPVRTSRLLVWLLCLGLALFIVSMALWGVGRTMVLTSHWARPLDQLFFLLAGGVIGGVVLFVSGFGVHRRKRLIESIPTSPIRSLAVGLVEVAGQAAPDGPLVVSPFSGIQCIFYSYKVEERRGSGKNARWVTMARGTSDQPFYVRDDTGRVLVVPLGADMLIAEKHTYRNEWPLDSSGPQDSERPQRGLLTLNWGVTGTYRCTEACIFPNQTVYVLGTAHQNPAAESGADNAGRLYIGSQQNESFIISDRTEEALVSQLGWRIAASLYGGPALTVTCLTVILKLYLVTGP